MQKRAKPWLAAFVFLALTIPAWAGVEEEALARLFEEEQLQQAWFTEAFLRQVPLSRLRPLIADLRDEGGALRSVEEGRAGFVVKLERAEVPALIALGRDGRIAGLLFQPLVPTGAGLQAQVDAIAALPGETSVLVLAGQEVRASHRPEIPLAVGSAAKLAVFLALKEAVEAGDLAWDGVYRLDRAWRSLPTGILQDWPAGTPLTLASLANLAISISDNTATDALISILGRDRVEAVAAENRPFLTTRELFLLKSRAHADLREEWVQAAEAQRRRIVEELGRFAGPRLEELEREPTLDVEWFFSAREICHLLEAVAGMPALSINPGLADADSWARVAFKGGSEAGVLNFSTWLQGHDGRSFCVVATWNREEDIAQDRLARPYRGILRALKDKEEG